MSASVCLRECDCHKLDQIGSWKMKHVGMRKRSGEPGTYSGQIVEKSDSPSGDDTSLYLRLSMGDYAIRCSGVAISDADLRQKVEAFVTLRGEIKRGEAKSLGDSGDYLLATELVD